MILEQLVQVGVRGRLNIGVSGKGREYLQIEASGHATQHRDWGFIGAGDHRRGKRDEEFDCRLEQPALILVHWYYSRAPASQYYNASAPCSRTSARFLRMGKE